MSVKIFSSDAVRRGMQPDPNRPCEESGSSLGLGELAQLTVANDSEAPYDVVSYKKSYFSFIV